jgi:hypothetical protein
MVNGLSDATRAVFDEKRVVASAVHGTAPRRKCMSTPGAHRPARTASRDGVSVGSPVGPLVRNGYLCEGVLAVSDA